MKSYHGPHSSSLAKRSKVAHSSLKRATNVKRRNPTAPKKSLMLKLPGVESGSALESLFIAVGFIVVQWGQAEQGLDLIVSTLSHAYPGKKAKRLPVMLETKIAFVRKTIPGTPELAHAVGDFEALLKEFEALAPLRHDLVHGAITSIEPTSRGFIFLKLDSDKEFNSTRLVLLSNSEFPSFRRRLLRLGKEANRLTRIAMESRPHAK